MKPLFIGILLSFSCLISLSHSAQASYFDGMEAYRKNDHQTAMREFRASEDDAKSLYMIGIMYEKGDGISTDLAEAANWFRKAAEKGYSSAQYRLGRLYERGLGVDQSRDEALAWYNKSSRNGNLDAKQALKRMGVK
ncbi:MAG: sel1 repeat family protein [Geobacteraceae bacterium]|nr:sel1 repeat family protein [Geobacteraceae bacterium]NTW79831.1 sel1 repeat family protein [Geobacteraceae bacterium]